MAQQHTSQSSSSSTRQIITKGYLMKQGNLLNKSFKRKYFILYQGRILKCFETTKCLKENGEIDLSQVSSINSRETKSTAKYKHQFDIITTNKTWILAITNNSTRQRDEWMQHLKESAFGNILFSGWLHKRGGKVQSWKHRYFLLSDTKILRYYEDQECNKYKGSLSLNDVIKIQTGDALQDYDHIIYLTTPYRIWCISAPNKQSQIEWIHQLKYGQDSINYDEKASIFVNLNINLHQCRNTRAHSGHCVAIERIKFVCCIYLKWLKSHITQQELDKIDKNCTDDVLQRAHTINAKYSSSDTSNSHKEYRSKTVDAGVLKLNNTQSVRKGIYNIINHDLKQYKNKELLNDFHHILRYHADYILEVKDQDQDQEEKKDVEVPFAVLRSFRNRRIFAQEENKQKKEDLYFNYDNIKEIGTQNILDQIYCHLYYSFQWCRLTETELNLLHDLKQNENDIDCKEGVILNTKLMLQAKRSTLIHVQQKYNLQLRENKFVLREKEEKQQEKYHKFGSVKYRYWESCKQDEFYVACKYKDLKDELLNNNISNISLLQYKTVYMKASELCTTDRALRTGAFEAWKIGSGIRIYVQRYNIQEDTPIKIKHIISCVMYCNHYQFSQEYRKTFVMDAREKHIEFAHFSRYLCECISVFGKPVNNNKRNGLYQVLSDDKNVILYYLSCCYMTPISLTNSLSVALVSGDSDGDYDGLIIKLLRQDNLSAFTMDCSWLSDFVFEAEHITMYNRQPMRVDTIIDMKSSADYNAYIDAMNALQNLLCSKLPLYKTNKITKKAVHKIISYKFNKHKIHKLKNNFDKKIVPNYIDVLFEKKCDLLTRIDIDCRQIFEINNKDNDVNNGCYNVFKSLLIDEDHDWIKIDLFIILFPNLISVSIRCYNHLIFDENTIQYLFIVLKSKIVENKNNFRIEFNEANQSGITHIDDVIKKYYKSFKKLNYEFLYVNESIIIRKENQNKCSNSLVSDHDDDNKNNNSIDDNINDKGNDDDDCCIM